MPVASQKRGLKYGFVLAVVELASTIPTLWATILEFRKENPGDIPADNLLDFVTAKDGGYNLCHFWSNFEIGDLNFFRSRQYQTFFDYLDRYFPSRILCLHVSHKAWSWRPSVVYPP